MHFGLWIRIFLIIHRRWGSMGNIPERRFPPWTVEEYRGISYIVRDANNFPVALLEDALLDAPRA